MAFIYDLTDTWNAGGTTFNAIKMNVTDSASAAASKLVSLQVGGSERFGVDKAGIGSFGSVVRAAAGSTSAPSFSFTGDTNTGMWSPAADTLAFSEGGVEAMRITSAGNVGIGTSAPVARLDVSGTSRNRLDLSSTTASWFTTNPAANAYAEIAHDALSHRWLLSSSNAMVLNSSGNVGIGTSSPGVRLEVQHNQATYSYFDYYNTTNAGGIVWRQIVRNLANTGNTSVDFAKLISSGFAINNNDNNAANFTSFGIGGSERMRIDSSGNLLVGKTTTSLGTAGFTANSTGMSATNSGAEAANFNRQGNDGDLVLFRRGGTQVGAVTVTATTTTYNTSSDARLKNNIVDAPEASALIDAIKVRSFKWNADNSDQRYGMVAQELLEVAPEAVSVPADEDQMMGVDYSKLVPMLIKEVQSLRARVAQLEGN